MTVVSWPVNYYNWFVQEEIRNKVGRRHMTGLSLFIILKSRHSK